MLKSRKPQDLRVAGQKRTARGGGPCGLLRLLLARCLRRGVWAGLRWAVAAPPGYPFGQRRWFLMPFHGAKVQKP